ncbi:hypothetical protein BaRGS_00037428 [Batillaria attramentaria]|uniref:BED-type domain-containing protein n=1 Tax=Batillaria attramentaria TaxID=370345 RepID=A0ABD0J934_9CAEN
MADSQEEFTIVPNSKAKAAIWRHFGVKKRKADGLIVESTAVCLSCQTTVKTAGGTSNMNAHIRRHHPQLLSASSATHSDSSQTEAPVVKQRQQTLPEAFQAQAAKKTKYPANSPRAKDITQKLAIFIVKDLRPYTLVENKQFRSLLAALDERYQCPSRD